MLFRKKRNIKKERESEYVSQRERERERERDGSVSSLSREGGYKVERDREGKMCECEIYR